MVGFDSQPRLIHDYTHSEEDLNEDLKHLEPGDGGSAILDTVSYAVDLLESQPKEYRRVLLLISEERDHGSKHAKAEDGYPENRPVRCAGPERVVLALARATASRHEGLGRPADHEHAFDFADGCAGVQEKCIERDCADEWRGIHHIHQRQAV